MASWIVFGCAPAAILVQMRGTMSQSSSPDQLPVQLPGPVPPDRLPDDAKLNKSPLPALWRRLAHRFLTPGQRRFIKFCVVGLSGVPVNLLFTWIGNHFTFELMNDVQRKSLASVLGIVVSIFTNFVLNDLWTWGDRRADSGAFVARLGRFYLACSVASGIQFGTAMGLQFVWKVHYLIAQLAGIILATAVNYVVNNLWTFRIKHHGQQ